MLALLLLGCAAAVQSADISEYYNGQGPKQSHYVTHVKQDDGPNGGFYRSEWMVYYCMQIVTVAALLACSSSSSSRAATAAAAHNHTYLCCHSIHGGLMS
jgi:hypothetical protein